MSVAPVTEQTKIKLYWLEQSRSQRVLWLLEELKAPYEIEIYHRDPKTHLAPPELKKIHPLGKSPIVSVSGPGITEPIVVAESANICEYLLEHFSSGSTLLPKKWREGQENKVGGETEEWLRYRFFMHYAEGTLMTYLFLALVVSHIKNAPVPFFLKFITNGIADKIQTSLLNPNFASNYQFLESQLSSSGGQYLCGPHLTGADILLSFPLIAGRSRSGLTKEKYPTLYAYINRLEEEPGYKKSIDKIIELDGKFETTL